MRRGVALLITLALTAPPVYASDVQLELGIRFGDGARTDVTLNGVALRTEPQRAHMTCPPPPESCAGMLTVFSLAAAASLVFLYALSKNRD
jgi:hypothetical protein